QSLPGEERRQATEAATRRRVQRMPAHLDLLDRAFRWARSERPEQPMTVGLFMPDRDLNVHLAALSDVITFHCYQPADRLAELIGRLRKHDRPLICTEY